MRGEERVKLMNPAALPPSETTAVMVYSVELGVGKSYGDNGAVTRPYH